jgi:hypothetical protein
MTHPIVRFALVFLTLLLVVPLTLPVKMVSSAGRGKKFRTVTRTFSSADAIAMPIADTVIAPADPYPAELTVGGFRNAQINDVNLRLLGFNQTHPDDVDILLVHDETNLLVLSDVGDALTADAVSLKLDDEAANPLPVNDQLVSGAFRPTNDDGLDDQLPAPAPAPSAETALAAFDSLDSNGQWQLFVVDGFGFADEGSIAGGWELRIKAKVRKTRRK